MPNFWKLFNDFADEEDCFDFCLEIANQEQCKEICQSFKKLECFILKVILLKIRKYQKCQELLQNSRKLIIAPILENINFEIA